MIRNFAVLVLGCLLARIWAADPAAMVPFLKKSLLWECVELNSKVPVNIYFITPKTYSRPNDIGYPVVVYVKNHGAARIGQEPDSTILMDYIRQHYIVITMDFQGNENAVSPAIEKDLHAFFRAIYGYRTEPLLDDIELTPRKYRCFFLPAGCRVATDLVFWELDKHGAYGTLEYIMKMYNDSIAGIVQGKKRVTSPQEMTDEEGMPFHYKHAMDIVYPSQAKERVPLVFYMATRVTRNPADLPSNPERTHMIGLLMRGYAYAIIDHCANPLWRHYWFPGKQFTLDSWNGLACYSAALRFIHAHADTFNYDEKRIGGIGLSKGQYAITRLSDPNNAKKKEEKTFDGFPKGSPEPQPWQGYSSTITIGFQSMGETEQYMKYVTPDYVPTLTACGDQDYCKCFEGRFNDFVDELQKNKVPYKALFMKGIGHTLPHGYDSERKIDRYQVFMDFFDSYLKKK